MVFAVACSCYMKVFFNVKLWFDINRRKRGHCTYVTKHYTDIFAFHNLLMQQEHFVF